ncbi:MAG: CBS domain-containing protein [Phycisphaerae bacterium]
MQLIEIGDTQVVQIGPNDSVDAAIALMEEHGIRHLPVVEQGHILGMVSDRDLLSAAGMMPNQERTASSRGPARIGATTVSQIMSSPAWTVAADAPLEAAAELMLDQGIRAIPLVYKERLAGIVTETDFLKCYLDDRPIARRPGWRMQKVADHMSRRVVTLLPGDGFRHAVRTMQAMGYRHIPIVDKGRLVGIVSDRDMRRALLTQKMEFEDVSAQGLKHHVGIVMRDIMTTDVETINPPATLAEVADVLVTHKFGALPVTSQGELVGIITESDLLRIFVESCKR